MDTRKLTGTLKWEVLFQVRGHDLDGLIDMMRYDRVTPATQSDVSLMNRLQFQVFRSLRGDRLNAGDLEDVVITMKAFTELKSWSPTVDRWRSFGWTVLDQLGPECRL